MVEFEISILGDRRGKVEEIFYLHSTPKSKEELYEFVLSHPLVQQRLKEGEFHWGMNTVDCQVRLKRPEVIHLTLNLTCYREHDDGDEDVKAGHDRQDAQWELILDLINKGWIK